MSNISERHSLHSLPNALTVSRVVAIPILLWCLLSSGKLKMTDGANPDGFFFILALVIFILCVLTDFLDGYIARKLKITSNFGRMLDPIADKLLVAACLIAICILLPLERILLIPALLIIGRDIFVSGIREHAANANLILSPTKLAKWKTAIEMLAITLFLVSFAYLVNGDFYLNRGLNVNDKAINSLRYIIKVAKVALWLAAALSVYTGFHYFREALKKS